MYRLLKDKRKGRKAGKEYTMWTEGSLLIDGTVVKYCLKHFEEPSEDYGIEGGRISIMELRVNGKVTLNYSRGWDVEPEDEASRTAYMVLLKKYN